MIHRLVLPLGVASAIFTLFPSIKQQPLRDISKLPTRRMLLILVKQI
jgi:hypothetical protein